ncbi:MAG: hypothetical protein R3282_03865 [Rhodothermales bacterium]|nr:hypothetical protein [Rhodothermales bacterium]
MSTRVHRTHIARLTAIPVILGIVALTGWNEASAQYDWTPHLSPVTTGFELSRFGTWDLELLPVKGMVDRSYYESDRYAGLRIRKIVETTRSAGEASGAASVFRHSTAHLDRQGRITRIEYADPLTRKVVQRETFKYDRDGRLLSWRRARPPSEVLVASVTRTRYPGRGPYGMAQTFSYDESGRLREWRACTISVEQRLEQCEEDYLVFDPAGRIVAFATAGTHHTIDRDVEGNAVRIEVREADGATHASFEVEIDGRTVTERPSDDSLEAGNVGWLDESGRLIQYRVTQPDKPEYYWTATWTYDSRGRPQAVQKGFDRYEYRYDAAGRLIEVKQSRAPESVSRTYDASGGLHSQTPPLFYSRLDAGLAGEERYTYDDKGFLTGISVRNSDGQAIAETALSYQGRGAD